MIDYRGELPTVTGMFKYVFGDSAYRPYDDIWRELPREEKQKHEIEYWQSNGAFTGDHVFTLVCKCGWLESVKLTPAIARAAMMGARAFALEVEADAERVIEGAAQHMRDVMAPYKPTLADFADWGWFDANVF